MKKKDHPFGICQRVFNFFMNSLIARGLKRVTLGHEAIEVPLVDPLTRNGEDSVGEQQATSLVRQSGVKKENHQARTRSKFDSGYDIQVHFKQYEEELEHWTYIEKPEAQKGNQTKLKKRRATDLPGKEELPLVQTKGDATGQGKSSQEAAAQGIMEPTLTTWFERRGIKDWAAVEDGAKEKGKRIASGNLKLAIEPEELKVKNRRHLFSVVSNINEKADEFIKSRQEAMRRNFSLEPEGS
uniref:Uncharacterized protein n=1 Tax=Rhizophora mucronata TaxID=61149 RepID=A0A2P2MZV0_RHIMU